MQGIPPIQGLYERGLYMVCAIQYMESKGNAHIRAGYVVNDGTHTVFVNTGTKDNTIPLYIYLGIGDTHRGKAVYDAAFIILMCH